MPEAEFVVQKKFNIDVPQPTSRAAAEAIIETLREWNSVKEWQRGLPLAASRYLEAPNIEKTGLPVAADVLIAMRMTYAAYVLKRLVEVDHDRAGGSPTLTGTRFKISRVLAELADGRTVAWLARNFDLDRDQISEMLHGLSILLDRRMA